MHFYKAITHFIGQYVQVNFVHSRRHLHVDEDILKIEN